VRPGLPSRDRPTGAPHLEQNRFSSVIWGSAMITERGSGTGAGGMDVIPAPSRDVRVCVVLRLRVGRVPPRRADPIGALNRRDELLVRVLPVRGLGVEALGALVSAAAGAPHTLQ